MFLSLMLTGCEEEGDSTGWWPDEISQSVSVGVAARATVTLLRKNALGVVVSNAPGVGRTVRIEINKAGREEYSFTYTTDVNGVTATATANYEVHEGEYVEVVAVLQGGSSQGLGAVSRKSQRFAWDQIWEKAGKEYSDTKTIGLSANIQLVDFVLP